MTVTIKPKRSVRYPADQSTEVTEQKTISQHSNIGNRNGNMTELTTSRTKNFTTLESSVKTQRVYNVRSGGEEPQFLEYVDMDRQLVLKNGQLQTLEEAHLHGLIHTGVWVHVIDSYSCSSSSSSPQSSPSSSRTQGSGASEIITNNVNDQHRLLLLKRGPQLVTCPSSWGLVGEHTNFNERPYETAFRAIVEELLGGTTSTSGGMNQIHEFREGRRRLRAGTKKDAAERRRNSTKMFRLLSPSIQYNLEEVLSQGPHYLHHDENLTTALKSVSFRLPLRMTTTTTSHEAKSEFNTQDDIAYVNVTIGQLSDYPIYYFRDYGSRPQHNTSSQQQEPHRIDRQVTWLMKAQFVRDDGPYRRGESSDDCSRFQGIGRESYVSPVTRLLSKFDDEVADHTWISIHDYEQKLYPRDGTNKTKSRNDCDGRGTVDGEIDSLTSGFVDDFCHPSIVKLARVGLQLLKFDLGS